MKDLFLLYVLPMFAWSAFWIKNCFHAKKYPEQHATIRRWHHILAFLGAFIPVVNLGIGILGSIGLFGFFLEYMLSLEWFKKGSSRILSYLDEPCGCVKSEYIVKHKKYLK